MDHQSRAHYTKKSRRAVFKHSCFTGKPEEGKQGRIPAIFRGVKAKTKCSAWDEMEAEPWPTGSSSLLRRGGRNDQTNKKIKSPFLETFPSGSISEPPTAFIAVAGTVGALGPISPEIGPKGERGSRAPRRLQTCLNVEGTAE